MEEEDLILKAYRGDKISNTINVNLKANIFGYEIYRIILILIDKILNFSFENNDLKEDKIKDFFIQMEEDYVKLYKKQEVI